MYRVQRRTHEFTNIMYILKDVFCGNYLSNSSEFDKKVQPGVGKFVFRPYDPLKVVRFESKEEALEALKLLEKRNSRISDIEIVEVFPSLILNPCCDR